jgi:hypothetical protein
MWLSLNSKEVFSNLSVAIFEIGIRKTIDFSRPKRLVFSDDHYGASKMLLAHTPQIGRWQSLGTIAKNVIDGF